MSMITRIFVVSLVILSLLLSAASITFVSSVDDYARNMKALEVEKNGLSAQLSRAESEKQAEIAAANDALEKKAAAYNNLESSIKGLRADLAKAGADLAAAKASLSISEANGSKLTSALQASEGTKGLMQQQVADLRTSLDKTQSQLGDINIQYNDTVNKLDVTETARKVAAEQLAEMRAQLDKVSSALRDRGVDPNRIGTSGVLAGAPPINGVIRETRVLSGVPHATISVGSEDSVKVGMEFKILDRTSGKFLGTLTIIAVEPSLSIGRLSGPDVAAITTGAEVRTQL